MKVRITWIGYMGEEEEIIGQDFPLTREEMGEIIQPVIDQWEKEGMDVDQGGDEEFYELDFPANGVEPLPPLGYEFLLMEVERKLADAQKNESGESK